MQYFILFIVERAVIDKNKCYMPGLSIDIRQRRANNYILTAVKNVAQLLDYLLYIRTIMRLPLNLLLIISIVASFGFYLISFHSRVFLSVNMALNFSLSD